MTLKIRSRSPIFKCILEANQFHNRSKFGSCSWKHCKVMLTTTFYTFGALWPWKLGQGNPSLKIFNNFSKIGNNSVNHIFTKLGRTLVLVCDGILIKYHIKIHCKLKQKLYVCHTNLQTLHFQKFSESNFIELWRRIVCSAWTCPNKILNSKYIQNSGRRYTFSKEIGKIDIFKIISNNK